MIRGCDAADFNTILAVINDAAVAYRGVIPPEHWHEPYMAAAALRQEINEGVQFWGDERAGGLIGVMGIQDVEEVTLIRHAYVRAAMRNHGIGDRLLTHLRALPARPMLIGTWAAASWAIHFYEQRGFRRVSDEERALLLTRYWTVPQGQIDVSVVLADQRWFERRPPTFERPPSRPTG